MAISARKESAGSNQTLAAAIVGRDSRAPTDDELPAVIRYLEDIDRALVLIPDFAFATDPTAPFDPSWSDERP